MTRMSEERLEAIRGCDQCVWISPGIPPTSCDFDRRDLLAEVDALRAELDTERAMVEAVEKFRAEKRATLTAELSAFRRAVLTDGAGGTEEDVTPAALEAELRLLRARPGRCEEVLEVAGDRIQCEFFRGHEGGHTGDAFDWSPVAEGGPRPDVKIEMCKCGHPYVEHYPDAQALCLKECDCRMFEATP